MADTSFTLNLSSAQTWLRPGPGNIIAGDGAYGVFDTVTEGADTYNFAYVKFTPTVTGTYDIKITATNLSDSMIFVYDGAFNPTTPLNNFKIGDDDSGDDFAFNTSDNSLWSGLDDLPLTAGQNYYLVMSSYTTGDSGDVSFTVSGAGEVTLLAGTGGTGTTLPSEDLTATNAAPTSTDDSLTFDANTTYALTSSDFGTFADTDASDTLTSVKITTLPTAGSLKYDGVAVTLDQTISKADIDAGKLTFTPADNASGDAYTTIGFKVSDSKDYSAAAYTLTLNVTPVVDMNIGFEDDLIGWTNGGLSGTLDTFDSSNSTAPLNEENGFTWNLDSNESKMAYLKPGNDVDFATVANAFGMSAGSQSYIQSEFDNDTTDFGYTYAELQLSAGQEITMAWNYIANDYAPYNDGSFVSFVNTTNPADTTSKIYGINEQVVILGATVEGTGNWSTGDYGSTGWQTITLKAGEAGTYKLGYAVFNLGDTCCTPYLFLDDGTPTTTKNGVLFAPVEVDPTGPMGDVLTPAGQSVDEDGTLTFSTANSNAITSGMSGATAITTTLSIGVGKGVVTLTNTEGVSVTNNASTTVQISGTADAVNSALQGATYNPTANANGDDYTSLTISTSDGVNQTSTVVNIDVTPVDDAPMASSMAATVGPNSKQLFSQFVPTFSDVDGDMPTQLKILTAPTAGNFEAYDGSGDRKLDSNWTTVTIDNDHPLIISMAQLSNYRFNAGDNTGTSTNVDWQVMTSGGNTWSNTATGVVTILDSATNTAPSVSIYQADGTTTLEGDTLTVAEDGTSTQVKLVFSDTETPEEFMQGIILSSNADLIDMSGISYSRGTTTETGDTVTLTFTPIANAYGSATITLGANDGDLQTTKTFTLEVTSVNDLPVVQDFIEEVDDDGVFYFNTIDPTDLFLDTNDMDASVDYNAQMAIIMAAQSPNATVEQQSAAGAAITALVEANYFPASFVITALPQHGDLYLGETSVVFAEGESSVTIPVAQLSILKYVPDLGYAGNDTFSWHALDSDGGESATKVATFNVVITDNAPTINGVPSTVTSVTAGTTVSLADFTVVDRDSPSLTVTLSATNGTIGGLTDGDANTAGIQLSGSCTDINAALVDATFTAAAAGMAGVSISVVDTAGSAIATTAFYSMSATAAVTPPSGGTTTPPLVTTTVDGSTVQTSTVTETRTTTDASGNVSTTTVNNEQLIIAPVSGTRTDSTGTATTADIPLFWGESSRTEWATTASLPTGVGLTTAGSRSPTTTATQQSALDDLLYYIDTTTPETDSGKTEMLSGGSTFLSALTNIETLVVNQITLSTTNTQASQVPVTITGSSNTVVTTGGVIAPVEALVIDAQSLQAGSTLNLQNVEFAVIIGENLTIRGGEGKNILFTGAGSQNIMLGADDDELYAGAGDDTVGSAGGDDLIFGESGNDTMFGGAGEDFMHGGSENDDVTYSGNMSDYLITRDNGKTYVQTIATGETDTLINTESISFSDGTYTIVNEEQLTKIASLYAQVLDRQADIDGFQYWAQSYTNGASMGDIATNFVRSSEYFNNSNNAWDSMNNDQRVEVFYELMLGRASDTEGKSYWIDAINNGILTIEQIAESFVESIEMQGSYTQEQGWNFFVA